MNVYKQNETYFIHITEVIEVDNIKKRITHDRECTQEEIDKYLANKELEIKNKKQEKIKELAQYRYDKQLYFAYDGHTQRFEPYDVQRMNDMAEALQNALISEINWAYPDGLVNVKEAKYLIDMKNAGYVNEQLVRGIELQVKQELEANIELDVIARFDELYNT